LRFSPRNTGAATRGRGQVWSIARNAGSSRTLIVWTNHTTGGKQQRQDGHQTDSTGLTDNSHRIQGLRFMSVPLIAAVPLAIVAGPPLAVRRAPGLREFLRCCPFTETADGRTDWLRRLTACFGVLIAALEAICSGVTLRSVSLRRLFIVCILACRALCFGTGLWWIALERCLVVFGLTSAAKFVPSNVTATITIARRKRAVLILNPFPFPSALADQWSTDVRRQGKSAAAQVLQGAA